MERLSMMSNANRATVGEPAPRFTCKAIIEGRIREFNSRTIMNDKQWLILIFFPMAWSFICPGEITAFSARLQEFSNRGCTVLFVSTDSEHVLKAWNGFPQDEGGLGGVNVPLLSDRNMRISRDYGVLIEEEGITQRAFFIIDPTGIIRSSSINDANVGRSVDEVARLLDALIFSDEYGQGCPVDWKAGQRGIDLGVDTDILLTPGPTWQASPKATPPQTPPAKAPAMSTSRPGIARGLSLNWSSSGSWGGKSAAARPTSMYSAASPNARGSASGTPTGARRPTSLFWDTVNEEAVGANGMLSAT